MEIITAQLSQKYDILINISLEDFAAYFSKNFSLGKILIVSDDTVANLHMKKLKNALESVNFSVFTYILPAGEESKNLSNTGNILTYMAENKFLHTDFIVALGGGMVGDIAGFAGSVYMRGICVVQIPTTLLAAVDSSVGGKTAVNLPHGKNLIGCFHQPALVACIFEFLKTQGKQNIQTAAGEIAKYAILSEQLNVTALCDFKELLHKSQLNDVDCQMLEHIITTCIKIKLDFVAGDECDQANRRHLNLGHTIAHAVEKLTDYTCPHGQAVGFGLSYITRISKKLNFCSEEDGDKILTMLHGFGFPDFDFNELSLADAILLDKKNSTDTVNFILPKKIGKTTVYPVKREVLLEFLCLSK